MSWQERAIRSTLSRFRSNNPASNFKTPFNGSVTDSYTIYFGSAGSSLIGRVPQSLAVALFASNFQMDTAVVLTWPDL